ncbi:MAG: putative sensor protein [Candidatus Eremiobacteraeota bacterium]|nr:putative sensor protein [Candidatus Eremiobacteraeota bacterium]
MEGFSRPVALLIAVAVASLAAVALLVVSALLYLRRRAAENDRANMLASTVPNMVWAATARGALDYCNRHFTDYTGLTSEALAAGGLESLVEPLERDVTMAAWHAAVGAGTSFRAETRLRRLDGTRRWHLMLADPARDEDGTIVRWFGSCTDIQDQKDAERVLMVLAEVTQALSASLDPLEIARALTDLVVPREIGYCEVHLYDADGMLVPAARAGDASVLDTAKGSRAQRVQRAGATLLTRDLSVVPIGLGEEILGWLVCCDVVDEVRALVPELASRLGAAVSNANAYAREHRVATTFQRAALSQDVPDVPGLRFSTLYQAAQSEASVGGDWYDALRLPDGRVVLSVGDVAGSGLEAAVTMASVRQSIRTAALINPDPVAVLDAVDRIVRAMGYGRFVTAFVAVYDPVCSELVVANAGHPPPLLRDAAGRVIELTHGDLPLGLRQPAAADPTYATIEPGSLMVAYTDGLTEFERDPETAHARLLEAVRLADENNADIAPYVFNAVSEGRPTHDDVAILTLWFGPALTEIAGERGASRWTFDVADAERAAAARRAYVARLRDSGLSRVELHAAELVFGELIGNVFRHARGAVDVMLDVSGTAPVLHVLDGGQGFEFRPRLPADLMAERGRGLFLVKTFADEFSMERRRGPGSHARAVLLGSTRVRATSAMTRRGL